MFKLKTNSGCKKRFKITATGKIKMKNANKRHNMRKHSGRQIREGRKADYMFAGDAALLIMPYGLPKKK